MAKKKVYICFDFEKDRNYKYLLSAWDANPDFEFSFNDLSPQEIQSNSISVIKGCISKKIQEANYTIVLVGRDINKPHKDRFQIDFINWQNYEVARSYFYHNKVILVKLPGYYQIPAECQRRYYISAGAFSQENIINALKRASLC